MYGTREQVPEKLFHSPSTTRPTVLACWEHRKLSLPLDTFVALFIHHVLGLMIFSILPTPSQHLLLYCRPADQPGD